MSFSEVVMVGKILLLACCAAAVVEQTCDRFMILGMKPPKFWLKSLQGRADAAAARFEKAFAAADAESKKHYKSEKLSRALSLAHLRFAADGTRLPWFSPRRFVEELEQRGNTVVAQLEDALAYQQSPAFLLETADKLRVARDGHPEKVARHIEQVESDFQQRLKRLQEAKEIALREGCVRHAELAQSIEEQLGDVETTLQQLVAGTTVNTIFP